MSIKCIKNCIKNCGETCQRKIATTLFAIMGIMSVGAIFFVLIRL